MTRRQAPGRHRTPQQRKRAAAARRAEELQSGESAPATGTTTGRPPASAPEPSPARRSSAGLGGLLGGGLLGGGLFGGGRQAPSGLSPAQADALAATRWTLRGRLTHALLIAVLMMPYAALSYLSSSSFSYDLPFAARLVIVFAPSLIPVQLIVAAYVAMPIARSLTREARPYRITETLGYVAVTEICLIAAWGPLYKSEASYTDGQVVAAAGLADILGLVAGAVVYGPISKYLSPRRRLERR